MTDQEHGHFMLHSTWVSQVQGSVVYALVGDDIVIGCDICVAGLPMLIGVLSDDLARRGVELGRIHIDGFGV